MDQQQLQALIDRHQTAADNAPTQTVREAHENAVDKLRFAQRASAEAERLEVEALNDLLAA